MLLVRGVIGGLFQVAFFAVVLLPAAGWDWPRAIQFLVAYGVLNVAAIVLMALRAPASLEARLQRGGADTQPAADRLATLFIVASIVGWLFYIPFDVFHIRLLPPPPLAVSAIGAILALAGYMLMLVALFQNAFAAPVVKDQSDRGQVLIDTGLYSRIRHPFYTGLLVFFAGLALWLESWASLVTLWVVVAALVVRMRVEEATLSETLPGYVEYIQRVRYRLIPFVW